MVGWLVGWLVGKKYLFNSLWKYYKIVIEFCIEGKRP